MSHRWQHSRSGGRAWRVQRARVLQRDGYECQLRLRGCLGTADQVDHMTPWTPGQVVPDSSLQAACHHCNSSAGPPEGRTPTVELPRWL